MEPVRLAGRLLLSCLFVWMFAWLPNCCTLLVYDRQSLLDIRTSFMDICKPDVQCVFNQTHRSFPTDIPECIRQWPLNITRRKRRRKRGCRGGFIVKLKAHLQAGLSLNPSPVSFNGGSVAWRPRDLAYRWLRPVLPLCRLLSPGMASHGLASIVNEMAWFLVTCAHWEELRSLWTLSLHPKWLWSMLDLWWTRPSC